MSPFTLDNNNLHSIRPLNKPLRMVADMENGKRDSANVPTLHSMNPLCLKEVVIFAIFTD